MKTMAIVLQNDGYDRLLTPLMFAGEQAKRGVQVDILFTLWAVRLLTETGSRSLRVDGAHANEEIWLRERLARTGGPVEIRDFLDALQKTGKVNLYGCAIAAAVLGVSREELIPAASGIMHPVTFLAEKAMAADHTQYF